MKKIFYLTALVVALAGTVSAQQPASLRTITSQPQPTVTSISPDLPRFDLDFEGGTPEELVEWLKQKLDVFNAIVPEEHKNIKLPALRMKQVNVSQLFQALEQSTRTIEVYPSGYSSSGGNLRPNFQTSIRQVGFRTPGLVTPESVWYFFVEGSIIPLDRSVQFFQLSPYLETYKIDDITTAVQAGWKMLGTTNDQKPELNYHEETKLLIASGTQGQLETIRSVLSQLQLPSMNKVDPLTGLPQPKPVAPPSVNPAPAKF